METMDLIVLHINEYTWLCTMMGLGWGLWITTLLGALIIDRVKWGRWIAGGVR